MSNEEIMFVIKSASNLAELNILSNVKIFLEKVMPQATTSEEKLASLKMWVDLCISELKKENKK